LFDERHAFAFKHMKPGFNSVAIKVVAHPARRSDVLEGGHAPHCVLIAFVHR
jgi:hypothetical protein